MLVTVERDVPMRLSDGTTLRSDVYRPAGAGPWPVLLVRLPYNKATGAIFTYAPPHWYAGQGYVVVVQDVRGRFASEGRFVPLAHEERDSAEAVEWAARLPGTTGVVGTYGGSYLGWVQLAGAVARPPSLRAAAPAVIAPDAYCWAWRGGAFNLHFAFSWMIEVAHERAGRDGRPDVRRALAEALATFPVHAAHQPLLEHPLIADPVLGDFLRDWMAHPDPADPYWAALDLTRKVDRISVPSIHVGGWYDMFVEGTIAAWQRAQAAHGGQRLLIGPWYHYPWVQETAAVDHGPEAGNPIDALQMRWFDRWLKDERNGVDEEPAVEVFVINAGRWWHGSSFPPSGIEERVLYLSSGGRANGSGGDGSLRDTPPAEASPDHYYADPNEPVPSVGGRSCCFPDASPMGPACQRGVHRYPTVLVYDSAPLASPLTVIGTVRAEIWFDSTAPDTDLVVQLCDHRPDGAVLNVVEGILRVRGADGGRVELVLGPTAIRFDAGHRVRLMVTSSLFPAYDRNHHDGTRDVDGGPGGTVTAMQTVLHDAVHPSCLRLPVLDNV